jgi:hypothetical protein
MLSQDINFGHTGFTAKVVHDGRLDVPGVLMLINMRPHMTFKILMRAATAWQALAPAVEGKRES